MKGKAGHSALMLAARFTFAHFSVSSAMSLPKSASVIDIGTQPRSAKRALILGSRGHAAEGLTSYRLCQRETSLETRQVFMAGPDEK